MSKDILVLSPHLDDAVLSCCNHIRMWQKQNCNIKIVTLFSAYNGGHISTWQEKIMLDSNISNILAYEQLRKNEDLAAMNALNVSFDYFDFHDAGFRHKKGKALYSSYQELTRRIDWDLEKELLESIVIKLNQLHFNGNIILPLSVGHHIDHQITKACGEKVFTNNNIQYYLDFPYARNPFKWNYEQIGKFLSARHSLKMMDNDKRTILDFYQSQVSYFFKFKAIYPEIVLYT